MSFEKINRELQRDRIWYFWLMIISVAAIIMLWANAFNSFKWLRYQSGQGRWSAASTAAMQHAIERMAPTQESLQILADRFSQFVTRDVSEMRDLMEMQAVLAIGASLGGIMIFMLSFRCWRLIGMVQHNAGGKDPAELSNEKRVSPA